MSLIQNNSINRITKFPCHQCEYIASHNRYLLRHIKSVHEGVRFPCQQCDYKYTRKGYILRHIKTIHIGINKSWKQHLISYMHGSLEWGYT